MQADVYAHEILVNQLVKLALKQPVIISNEIEGEKGGDEHRVFHSDVLATVIIVVICQESGTPFVRGIRVI